MNKIINFINNKYSELGIEDFNTYFSLLILNFAITIVFIFLTSMHIYYEHDFMARLTTVMIFVFFIVNYAVYKGCYELSFFVMFIQMIIYISINAFFIGNKTNDQILMLYFIVPQFTYKISRRKKIIINTIAFLFILLISFSGTKEVSEVLYNQSVVFSKFNIIFLYIILIIQLTSTGFLIGIVEKIKDVELQFFKTKSQYDELTGLSNRFFAEGYFGSIYSTDNSKNYVIAVIDIDDFKKINDNYGHNYGDLMLIELANSIKTQLREKDLICRWGGEEFLIILEGIELEQAKKKLDRLRENISKIKVPYEDKEITMTVTIGAVVVDNKDIHTAIEEADKKLYKGKKSGKNKVVI